MSDLLTADATPGASGVPDATTEPDPYRALLARKVHFQHARGFAVDGADIAPLAKPHQRDAIRYLVTRGRAGAFLSFGLGKTLIQLETLRLTLARAGGRALIICPLGVRQEFAHDAALLGYGPDIAPRFVRRTADVGGPGLYLTNYESVRDGKLDVNLFTAVSLDEASVLRSFGSKTYQMFLSLFDAVPYRFVATATPSPNRYKELIHYAAFLGIMDSGQALTRFFQRDSEQANNLTLYPHMEAEFFLWLHSWGLFVQSPADLGHDATGYDLPPLHLHVHEVPADAPTGRAERDGQFKLIADAAVSLKDAADEKRRSIAPRLAVLRDVLAALQPDDQLIVWCELNAEQDAVEALCRDAGQTYASIRGDDGEDLDAREAELFAWKRRERRVLIGKPVMLGSGVNLQQCNRALFLGITYKFNDFIQACHRIHRFLQTRDVHVHVVMTDSERGVWKELRRKWAEDDRLRATMAALIRTYGTETDGMERALTRSLGVARTEARGAGWTYAHHDTVDEARLMGDGEVTGMILTSVPFGNHYEYSASYNDFGHNADHRAFFAQMDHLTPELYRILAPGRIAAVHVKDRIQFGNVTGDGFPTVEPFHADCIAHYRAHGFRYCGMITVVTDVVRENNQTYRLGWTEQSKDGTKMGVGSPEYVLLFRKPPTDRSKGYADVPVAKAKADYTRARWQLDAHAFWRSSGNRLPTADELAALAPGMLPTAYGAHSRTTVYDYAEHVAIGRALEDRGALPATFMALAPASHHPDVWTDVLRMRTLNGDQARRNVQLHVCPLQLDLVDRLIERYTNPGELVYDPFGGLGTVPVRALALGREGRGVELNAGYFADAVAYLRAEEEKRDTPTLFSVLEASAA